jgi:hypothetical protein
MGSRASTRSQINLLRNLQLNDRLDYLSGFVQYHWPEFNTERLEDFCPDFMRNEELVKDPVQLHCFPLQ